MSARFRHVVEWNLARSDALRVIRAKLCGSMIPCHSRDTVAKLAKLQPSCSRASNTRFLISAGRAGHDILRIMSTTKRRFRTTESITAHCGWLLETGDEGDGFAKIDLREYSEEEGANSVLRDVVAKCVVNCEFVCSQVSVM
jgi:hypothetical protein